MTSWIANVVPDQTIESAWGNLIRDRTITPFANAAARNAAIPTPKIGMLTYQLDTFSLEVATTTTTAGWRPVSLSRYSCTSPLFGTMPADGTPLLALENSVVVTTGAGGGVNIPITPPFTQVFAAASVMIGDNAGGAGFVRGFQAGHTLSVWTGSAFAPGGAALASGVPLRLSVRFVGI